MSEPTTPTTSVTQAGMDALIATMYAVRWPDGRADGMPSKRITELLADAILAAGWRPPARTVSTVEEIQSVGSQGAVLLDKVGSAWQFYRDGWETPGIQERVASGHLVKYAPMTVIHEGGA